MGRDEVVGLMARGPRPPDVFEAVGEPARGLRARPGFVGPPSQQLVGVFLDGGLGAFFGALLAEGLGAELERAGAQALERAEGIPRDIAGALAVLVGAGVLVAAEVDEAECEFVEVARREVPGVLGADSLTVGMLWGREAVLIRIA